MFQSILHFYARGKRLHAEKIGSCCFLFPYAINKDNSFLVYVSVNCCNSQHSLYEKNAQEWGLSVHAVRFQEEICLRFGCIVLCSERLLF